MLICRLLNHDPWRILDLLHRRIAGASMAGHALCSAAFNTLTVIGLNSSLLLARARGHADVLCMLASTAGSCIHILASVSLMLPAAVLQMLILENTAGLALPGPGSIWLISTLEGVHQLESAWGEYPAAVEGIKLVESLIKCMGLTDDLLTIVIQILSGMGCYHTHWHLKETANSWDVTIAVLSMVQSALGFGSLTVHDPENSKQNKLLHSLLHDGLLLRLFWVRSSCPPTDNEFSCWSLSHPCGPC